MGKKQTTSSLPHLPHSIAMPQVQVTGERPMMPGQKSLPTADWKNNDSGQQMVPGMDTNRRANKKAVVKQGVPCTSRPSKNPLPANVEPPPMFSSQPSTVAALRSATESKTQKQMHRMEGGIDPVVLLTNRLESWRLAIKNLVAFFKKVVLVENRTSKGLSGASSEIELPFKGSNGLFLESGGMQDVFAAIRDYTMQHGIMHHETSSYLQGAVIPAFRAIKADIKTMILQIEKDKSLKSNYIYDSRTHVNRLIDRLGKTIESAQYSPHTADQNPDPFLLNLSVIHAIRDLCDHENRLHDNIMNLQQEVAIFEAKIIENTRHILQGYHDYRLENKMEHRDFIGTITDTFDNMEPSTEWNSFVQRNQYNLVQANSAYKTENDIDYPSQHSRFVRASKIGPLQLKTGITKGWTEGIYILTPAGYLHGYKTPKHFQTNPLRPTYSIFVPHSTVDTDEDSFEIRSNQDKKISMGNNHYIFRAPTRAENQAWYESLSGLSQKFQSPPLLESTENNFSNTPSHRDLPPLPASILPIEAQQRRAIEPAPEQQQQQQQQHASSVRQIEHNETSPIRQESAIEENNQQQQQQQQQQQHMVPVQREATPVQQASPVRQASPMRQQKQENVPTPKQQYLKAYPAAERADVDLEHPPVPPKTPIDYNKSRNLGRSDTISGDNQLANISAGGNASTNSYVAGPESHYRGPSQQEHHHSQTDVGKYESTKPIVTNVYEGRDKSNRNHSSSRDNFGEYESTKPITTDVYEGAEYTHRGGQSAPRDKDYGEYESTRPIKTDVYEGVDYSRSKHHHGSRNDYGEYESTKPIITDVYEGAQHTHDAHHHASRDHHLGKYESSKPSKTDVYEGGGKHTHGKHHHSSRDNLGKYESTKPIKTDVYDDDDTSDEMDTAIHKHSHNSNLGKYAYTSSDREKYSLGGHTPLESKQNEGYSYGKNFRSGQRTGNEYGTTEHHRGDTGDDFDTSGRYTKSNNMKDHYEPKMADRFDDDEDSFTLGRDEYSNSKGGLPGQ